MKTCLMIPVYNSANTLPKLFRCLDKLNPAPDLTVFCENNSKDTTVSLIKKHYKKTPHKIIGVWFRKDATQIGNPFMPIACIRDLLLTVARSFNADYNIFLDSDIYPQNNNLITQLTGWERDIVGGAIMEPMLPKGDLYADAAFGSPETGFFPCKTARDPLNEVAAAGTGCLCLSRRAVQDRRLSFLPLLRYRGELVSEDFGFCLRARSLGYKIFLDGVAVFEHGQNFKKPRPWRVHNGKHCDFTY
jgi:glycosyltransferase involved in cell wall biosynthesis